MGCHLITDPESGREREQLKQKIDLELNKWWSFEGNDSNNTADNDKNDNNIWIHSVQCDISYVDMYVLFLSCGSTVEHRHIDHNLLKSLPRHEKKKKSRLFAQSQTYFVKGNHIKCSQLLLLNYSGEEGTIFTKKNIPSTKMRRTCFVENVGACINWKKTIKYSISIKLSINVKKRDTGKIIGIFHPKIKNIQILFLKIKLNLPKLTAQKEFTKAENRFFVLFQ